MLTFYVAGEEVILGSVFDANHAISHSVIIISSLYMVLLCLAMTDLVIIKGNVCITVSLYSGTRTKLY